MGKLVNIELLDGTCIVSLYEDRSVLAIDKPPGWMLAPSDWDRTGRNLQLALESALVKGNPWARSRGIKYLRFVHRLDAETSGILLLAKSQGAIEAYSKLFENQHVDKVYLAVVQGVPAQDAWSNRQPIAPRQSAHNGKGRGRPGASAAAAESKEAHTEFLILRRGKDKALVLAQPLTGRTHQIRVHLATDGFPIVGDPLYGGGPGADLALRSTLLRYRDPFTRKPVSIEAPWEMFLRKYRFELSRDELYQRAQRQNTND